MSEGERVGEVIHFYGKINVGVLRCTKGLQVGDVVHFLGRHTDFEQEISSMQIEHAAVKEAKKGDSVGIKVPDRVRSHDKVFKVLPEE